MKRALIALIMALFLTTACAVPQRSFHDERVIERRHYHDTVGRYEGYSKQMPSGNVHYYDRCGKFLGYSRGN